MRNIKNRVEVDQILMESDTDNTFYHILTRTRIYDTDIDVGYEYKPNSAD